MSKTRSPNYPVISLPEAVDRIDKVYKQEVRNPMTREVIAKALGYKSVSGASIPVISALGKYKLLEQHQGQHRVSSLALDIILHEPGESERVKAVEIAAFAPMLFSELRDHYGGTLPSDNNLRSYLLKNEFNPRTVGDVIHAYRDTIEFVQAEKRASSTIEDDQEGEASVQTPASHADAENRQVRDDIATRTVSRREREQLDQDEQELSFKIAIDCTARVILKGNATQEAIDKLVALLDLQKDVFPTRASLQSETINLPNETGSPSN